MAKIKIRLEEKTEPRPPLAEWDGFKRSPEECAAHLLDMEKLEIYNIVQEGRQVYPISKNSVTWRRKNIIRMLVMGVIIETDEDRLKAYHLSPLGEKVYPLIIADACLVIAQFRLRE